MHLCVGLLKKVNKSPLRTQINANLESGIKEWVEKGGKRSGMMTEVSSVNYETQFSAEGHQSDIIKAMRTVRIQYIFSA